VVLVPPNVRAKRTVEAGRLGSVGENVLRTADRAKVACRSGSALERVVLQHCVRSNALAKARLAVVERRAARRIAVPGELNLAAATAERSRSKQLLERYLRGGSSN